MNKQIHNGGPAFPAPNWFDDTPVGMTLRDYFAAKAMAAMIVARGMEADQNAGWPTYVERESYKVADAMLAAREVKA